MKEIPLLLQQENNRGVHLQLITEDIYIYIYINVWVESTLA